MEHRQLERDSVLAANTQDLASNALLLPSFLSLLCPWRSRFTWLAATLSDIPPGFFLNTGSNIYKVLVFPLLISGQFLMNPGTILGSTKTLIGHRIQQSGEVAFFLPECGGVILPAEPPFSLPSCLGFFRECVEACPLTFSWLCLQLSMVRIPPQAKGNQVEPSHGDLFWHMGKLRPQRCNDPLKSVCLVLTHRSRHYGRSDMWAQSSLWCRSLFSPVSMPRT